MVSTAADRDELQRARRSLGRDPLVLTAPSIDAKQVVGTLRVEPRVEMLLAQVRFPAADRGHQLDSLVRRHAFEDRFRDVVVVADPATCVLLLRVLAPDQLAERAAVTVVGLPREDRRIPVRRAVGSGVALGFVASAAAQLMPILVLPGVAALVGLVLLLLPAARHVGRELLLVAVVGLAVALVVVSSSQRFPA